MWHLNVRGSMLQHKRGFLGELGIDYQRLNRSHKFLLLTLAHPSAHPW